MKNMRGSLLLLLVFVGSAVLVCAQTSQGLPPTDELYKTVAGLDTTLFDAYNHCDLDKLGSMVVEDLEFYHDQTGLTVGRKPFVDAIKANICGKVHRELVAGTLEVYPLKGFGAVEMCVRRFSHPSDPNPGPGGEAKSVMLWEEKDGAWMLTRVISFDHRSLGK
jgi:Domain of unknown function (DUF4440)